MTKHKYSVYGVFQMDGSLFSGTCVSDDIVKVIEMFREKGILYGISKEKNK